MKNCGLSFIHRGNFNPKLLSGFTLLEVMIALLILAIGLASVFSLFGTATRSLHQAVTDEMVTCYANTIFSELDSGTISWSIPPQNLSDQTHPDFPDYVKYDMEFTTLDVLNTTIPDAGLNAVLVALTVKWPRGPKYQSEKFQMLLLKKNK